MLIKVTVIPRAKKAEVIVLSNNYLRVKIPAMPVSGRANKRLIEMLAEYYGVRKSAITITRGERSREKVVEVLR
jgi:uncharacterized protein (TIGR00251 family)